ncbi:unnamed protein product [Vicia faba]|uniref:Uncharacterized protein n=1 Tax=Vicia faba TaxID=3906 RepID=A0AAV1A3U6_VICFA|nr:unnamed protein product [Vicia faba]
MSSVFLFRVISSEILCHFLITWWLRLRYIDYRKPVLEVLEVTVNREDEVDHDESETEFKQINGKVTEKLKTVKEELSLEKMRELQRMKQVNLVEPPHPSKLLMPIEQPDSGRPAAALSEPEPPDPSIFVKDPATNPPSPEPPYAGSRSVSCPQSPAAILLSAGNKFVSIEPLCLL